MNTDQIEDKIISAFEGELRQEEYDSLLSEVNQNMEWVSIWESYRRLYDGLDTMPPIQPSQNLKQKFDSWVDTLPSKDARVVDLDQKAESKSNVSLWQRWAGIAALLVVVFGFWSVYQQNLSVERNLDAMTAQMEGLLNQQSSTERIKAIRVNFDSNSNSVDDKMMGVLVDVLKTDKSSNVRLAAVESLNNFITSESVRKALIEQLVKEEDAGVKLAIITSLGQYKDGKVKSTLEKIVNDDSQEKFIIDEAHMQLIRFETIDM